MGSILPHPNLAAEEFGILPEVLQRHRWKGNIRDLKNVIERAVILADAPADGPPELPPALLPLEMQESAFSEITGDVQALDLAVSVPVLSVVIVPDGPSVDWGCASLLSFLQAVTAVASGRINEMRRALINRFMIRVGLMRD